MRNSLLFILLLVLIPTAYAKRYALVIGNSNYSAKIGKLKNPVNDATDMAAMLRKKKFIVTVIKNASRRKMKEGINSFTRQLSEKDAVGLFFFAGHGMEVGGRNYLIPIGANIQGEGDVEYESVDAGRVMNNMRIAGNNLNMVILDACRNNPFSRSFRSASRGLTRMDPPKGSLILYATSPGDVAADGSGRNGLFTQHLLQAIDTPNFTVEKVFKATANKVYRATDKKQLPWQSGVMLGDFYFSEGAVNQSVATLPLPVTEAGSRHSENIFWTSIQNETNPAYFESYLQKYPNGLYATLAQIKLNQASVKIEPQTGSDSVEPMRNHFLPDMVNIPEGCYQMGSPSWEADRDDDEQRHEVCVNSFQMSTKEVTVGEFRQFVDTTGYRTQAEKDIGNRGCYTYSSNEDKWDWRAGHYWDHVGFKQNDQHPVVCVSWVDVKNYIGWLNENSVGGYRLPTEAEWEYAARAGTQSAYFWGNEVDSNACHYGNIADRAHDWHNGFSCDDGMKYTNIVGHYRANDFGLYDMSGNVWEWTCSKYDQGYTGDEEQCISSKHTDKSDVFVLRGGSFSSKPVSVRMALRYRDIEWGRDGLYGFRLARTR